PDGEVPGVQVTRKFCQTGILKSMLFRQPAADQAAGASVAQKSRRTAKTMNGNKTTGPATAEKNKRVLMYTRFLNTRSRHPLTREGQLISTFVAKVSSQSRRPMLRQIHGHHPANYMVIANTRKLPKRPGSATSPDTEDGKQRDERYLPCLPLSQSNHR